MDLNLTSANPSAIETPFFTHHGKVPRPICLRTFGLLGAVVSGSTCQRGFPLPVTPHVQPGGSAPTAALSKSSVSVYAFIAMRRTRWLLSTSLFFALLLFHACSRCRRETFPQLMLFMKASTYAAALAP